MISGLNNITKRPIIIISGPRTGSTALAHHVASLYPTTRFFNEPNFTPPLMEKFINYSIANKKNDYILKLLGTSLNLYPADTIATIFSNETFKIKISRKNIIEQIASHYVADFRNMWIYNEIDANTHNELTTTNIEFDLLKIRRSIARVKHDNSIVSKISADIELFYEDFTEFLSPTKKTPIPANYDSLITVISNLYSPGIS
jgi:hypothetical protein